MPYANVPQPLWGKMDDCVAKVKGKGAKNAYAVCYASVVGAGIVSAARSRVKAKGGKK